MMKNSNSVYNEDAALIMYRRYLMKTIRKGAQDGLFKHDGKCPACARPRPFRAAALSYDSQRISGIPAPGHPAASAA